MIISDLPLSSIRLNDPREVDSQYIFDLDCSGMPLTFSLSHTVEINHKDNGNLHLSVQNKSDVLHLHQIYSHIFNIVLTQQNEWFENSFEEKDLNDMFKPFLAPNYQNNCIDLICSTFSEHKVNNIDANIIPLILLKSVVFDGSSFHIEVELKDFQELVINHTQVAESETTINNVNNNNNTEISAIENVGIDSSSDLGFENNTEKNHLEENIEDDHSEDGSIQSVIIDENNIEKLNMKINDEDFYLLFRLVRIKNS